MAKLHIPPPSITQLAWQFADKAAKAGFVARIELTRGKYESHHILVEPEPHLKIESLPFDVLKQDQTTEKEVSA
jgi:hypothetical protein